MASLLPWRRRELRRAGQDRTDLLLAALDAQVERGMRERWRSFGLAGCALGVAYGDTGRLEAHLAYVIDGRLVVERPVPVSAGVSGGSVHHRLIDHLRVALDGRGVRHVSPFDPGERAAAPVLPVVGIGLATGCCAGADGGVAVRVTEQDHFDDCARDRVLLHVAAEPGRWVVPAVPGGLCLETGAVRAFVSGHAA